jgi:transcriptional regulator with XRE-family HTH domain
MSKFTPISVHDLGEYLREQRQSAQLSLRQLSEVAGISNPYISQIERGLKKPSAEILQALAKALRISAESLYVRAGILEERTDLGGVPAVDVTGAILADPKLNDRQRAVLLDVYESFVGETAAARAPRTSMPTNSTRVTKAAKPRRTPSPAKEPRPAQAPIRAQMTPAQKTPAQKKTQQSSNKEKKS